MPCMIYLEDLSFTFGSVNGGYNVYDSYYKKTVGVFEQGNLIFNDNPTILKMDTCDLETTDGVYIGQLKNPRQSEIIDPSNER